MPPVPRLIHFIHFIYGLLLSLTCNLLYPISWMRVIIDALGSLLALGWVRKVHRSSVLIDGIRAEVISPQSAVQCTLLYLHGGGYFMGSIRSHRAFASRFAVLCKAKVVLIEYRRAPEAPFPAALTDAVCCYKYIQAHIQTGPLFLFGDSAGGGLSLALGLYLRDHGISPPQGIVAISPWTDLTGSGTSIQTNQNKDVWLSKKHVDGWGSLYATDAQKKDPYVSPVFGNYQNMPNILLLVGDQEILLDDASRIAKDEHANTGSITLHVGTSMQHAFPITLPFLHESKRALFAIQAFVSKQCAISVVE